MRLLTFNIRQGGGKRVPRLAAAVARHRPDVAVLTEFRDGPTGAALRTRLADAGLVHQASSGAAQAAHGVLVVARQAFTVVPTPDCPSADACRWLECRFAEFDVVGAYFPLGKSKKVFWRWFLGQVAPRAAGRTILTGDFNSGKHYIDEEGATLHGPEFMTELEELGFVDAWRRFQPDGREYSWYSHAGNGFRLDHAFVAPALADMLIAAEYSHDERIERTSDHSCLWVDFRLSPSGAEVTACRPKAPS